MDREVSARGVALVPDTVFTPFGHAVAMSREAGKWLWLELTAAYDLTRLANLDAAAAWPNRPQPTLYVATSV